MKRTMQEEWDIEPCLVRHRPTGFTMSRHPGQPEPAFSDVLQDDKGYEIEDLLRMGTFLLYRQWEREEKQKK